MRKIFFPLLFITIFSVFLFPKISLAACDDPDGPSLIDQGTCSDAFGSYTDYCIAGHPELVHEYTCDITHTICQGNDWFCAVHQHCSGGKCVDDSDTCTNLNGLWCGVGESCAGGVLDPFVIPSEAILYPGQHCCELSAGCGAALPTPTPGPTPTPTPTPTTGMTLATRELP